MDFAEKVKIVRENLKISQEKMAQLLGVSFSTVNRWEQGKALPSYATIFTTTKRDLTKRDRFIF